MSIYLDQIMCSLWSWCLLASIRATKKSIIRCIRRRICRIEKIVSFAGKLYTYRKMSSVKKEKQIPDDSIITDQFERVDYYDCFSRVLLSHKNVDDYTSRLFKTPSWVNLLMRIRNIVVPIFGLEASDILKDEAKPFYTVGEKAVMFTVHNRNKNEIVMFEEDKHLNFRTSVLAQSSKAYSTIYLSTIVQFNNTFGRIYFFFVKPFHCLIVRQMLKRLRDEIQE
jgi:hypothetical protein